MRDLVIGCGEIGTAVIELLLDNNHVVESYDSKDDSSLSTTLYPDVLHICFPYTDKFIGDVEGYIAAVNPKHIIIWSTVPIGTTKKIKNAVHTPVEGRHPKLAQSIKSMTRWIGANSIKEAVFFEDYFLSMYLLPHVVESSDYTEFLKLRSTSKFGINLVWTDYEAHVAKEIGMDFKLLKNFDKDYNRLYHNLGMDWAQRYILDAPNGKIGGHCVVPNAELLNKQFPNDLLKMIKEMR